MFQAHVPHHDTGGFRSHRKFLPDKEYGDALDALVKGVSDMLLVHPVGGRILLGKRKVQPQPDWWFTGGRIFPGETPAQSCCRLLKRELSLDIAPERFETVCSQSLAWAMREQDPKENGTTDIQVALSLQLTEDEVGKVVLDPKEYADSQWIEPAAVVAGDFHPALKFAVRSLLAVRKLRELQRAVSAQPACSDAEVAALAREFCALSADTTPPAGVSEYRVVAPALDYECEVAVTL